MYDFRIVDSLDKIVPSCEVNKLSRPLSIFKNDKVSFQIAYRADEYRSIDHRGFKLEISWPRTRLRKEVLVPVALPTTAGYDDDYYITKIPTMLPDRLEDFDGIIHPVAGHWRGIWVDLYSSEFNDREEKSIDINIYSFDDKLIFHDSVTVRFIPRSLSKSAVHHTEWFHVDCLADYYHLVPYSEKHWLIIENFMKFLHDETCADMVYTPLLTPALDTYVGGERTTVQLVDIKKDKGGLSFDFNKLRRWAEMARRIGFDYLEISHLFTQWGAEHCPKVMAMSENGPVKIFGWETSSLDVQYIEFLEKMLPKAIKVLEECGYPSEKLYFHISDEPRKEHMENYLKVRKSIEPILGNMTKFDALSSLEFYRSGAVNMPVVAANHVEEFMEAGADPLWVYYCVSQGQLVPNRFMALPNYRSRIIGLLIYMHDIKGFLHWGFNFYNSQYSRYHINPYITTDADSAFPSGDPFLVYPGDDGCPISSIRNEIIFQAFRDLRILSTAEKMYSRERVLREIGEKYTFFSFPQNSEYIKDTMERITELII